MTSDGGASPESLHAAASPIPATAADPAVTAPRYDGTAGRLAGIVLGNSLLGVITLGFYRFWGTTRLRRYIWSHIRLWDDSLVYTGRGMELFVGFLLAMLVLVPIFLAYGGIQFLATGTSPLAKPALDLGLYTLIYFLLGIALFRARRYRLSRTTWREIRAAQTGSSLRYGLMWLGYGLLALLTLGLAAQVRSVRLQSFTMRNTWFGDRRFAFDGRAGDMFGRWLACWALAIPTLGLSLLWFSAYRTRYFAERTVFENVRFALPVTFGDFFRILFPYFLLIALLFALPIYMFSDVFAILGETSRSGRPPDPAAMQALEGQMLMFGIAMFGLALIVIPVVIAAMVTHRFLALYSRRLAIVGAPDFAAIAQSAHLAPSTGEGLADALDVGGGI